MHQSGVSIKLVNRLSSSTHLQLYVCYSAKYVCVGMLMKSVCVCVCSIPAQTYRKHCTVCYTYLSHCTVYAANYMLLIYAANSSHTLQTTRSHWATVALIPPWCRSYLWISGKLAREIASMCWVVITDHFTASLTSLPLSTSQLKGCFLKLGSVGNFNHTQVTGLGFYFIHSSRFDTCRTLAEWSEAV